MLHKTQGVVFRLTKYGETSIIVSIFTELFGLQSYIVNGVRSKTSKNRIALYQPLTLLDLVVYHRENANLNRIREIKCLYPYQSITIDVKKSGIAIFINEVLNKTVKEESHSKDLCSFLIHSMMTLDAMDANYENFHLIFLVKLSRWLGFGANQINEVLGGRMASVENEEKLHQLLSSDYEVVIPLTNTQRRELLDLILKFFADHIEAMGELKSIQVLREVLSI